MTVPAGFPQRQPVKLPLPPKTSHQGVQCPQYKFAGCSIPLFRVHDLLIIRHDPTIYIKNNSLFVSQPLRLRALHTF